LQFGDVSQGNDPEIYDVINSAGTVNAEIKNIISAENNKPQQENNAPIQKVVEKPPITQKKEDPPAPQPPEIPAPVKTENISAAQPQKEIPEQVAASVEQKPAETVLQTEKPIAAVSTETTAVQEAKIIEQPMVSNEPEMVEIDSPDDLDQGNVEKIETGQPEDDATQHLDYTNDMPVEEILKVMTLGEAGLVVVDTGVFKGRSMLEVMENKPGSLKWYKTGYTGDSNIMRAAASIMLDYYTEQQKKSA
jgi:hypothetical protein